MQKLYFYFICLPVIFCFQSAIAQEDNQLIKLRDLTFKNETEKETFVRFNSSKDSSNVFDLLFNSFDKSQIGNRELALQKINKCVSYLQSEVGDKSEAKKVKFTYDYVHKEFLNVYKLRNSFINIFETGEYNCVSASALYAVIFSRLSIPYQIKETPEHVYLIAYPNSSKILIETTSPTKGYYQFNTAYITNFVKHLYDSKIITKEDYESQSANDLFNKHYFTSANISLLQLAGLQYSNFALYYLDDKDLKNANEETKKAYFLFPGERHKFLLKSTVAALLDKDGYENADNISNLLILCRFINLKSSDINSDVIYNEFGKILRTQLIKNSDYDSFEKSYTKITNELSDSTLKGEIGFAYHYELARLGYANSKSKEYEMTHLTAAYLFNPRNADLRSLIFAEYTELLRKYDDSKSIMELSDNFAVKFDFLKDNDSFLSVKANCILDLAYQSFFYSNITKGDTYLTEFEQLLKTNNNVSPTATFVEKAYSQAASEYYRKGNQVKAKQYLKSGLIYAPNSFGLQQRINQLK